MITMSAVFLAAGVDFLKGELPGNLPETMPALQALIITGTRLGGTVPSAWFEPGVWEALSGLCRTTQPSQVLLSRGCMMWLLPVRSMHHPCQIRGCQIQQQQAWCPTRPVRVSGDLQPKVVPCAA